MKGVPGTAREPRVRVVRYGTRWTIRCDECGVVETVVGDDPEIMWRDCWEHQRYVHPTEDEQAWDAVGSVMADLPGCRYCGRDDHDTESCPSNIARPMGTLP